MDKNDSKNGNKNKKRPSLPDKISSIADDEAITEIDLNEFLIENSRETPFLEGFHDDIEKTEKSLEDELQSLYDDIVRAGPETIVPKPLSELTSDGAEPEKAGPPDPERRPDENGDGPLSEVLPDLPDYPGDDVGMISPDSDGADESADAASGPETHDDKSAIFQMIETLRAETEVETGFDEILSEIESNKKIIPVKDELSAAAELVDLNAPRDGGTDSRPADGGAFFPGQEKETDRSGSEETEEDELKLLFENLDEEWETLLNESEAPPLSDELNGGLPGEIPEKSGAGADVEERPAKRKEFSTEIPSGGSAAGTPTGKLYEAEPMSSKALNVNPDSIDAENGKPRKRKSRGRGNRGEAAGSDAGGGKKTGAGEIARRIVLAASIITIIVSGGILVNAYLIEPFRFKTSEENLARLMNENISRHSDARADDELKEENPKTKYPEGMLAKYAQLYAINNDLAGWISIPGLDINLPIAKGKDNRYYTKRDIYRKRTSYGVSFFDYRTNDLKNLSRNTVVYGHNMRHDDYIFGMLENYREIKGGFAQSPAIECNTIFGDHVWFVYAVFISNSKRSQDNGYLFPYNFLEADDERFAEYIKEIDKRKLYTTGVDINARDKILTLSTCCYDFEGARLVVVARERRAGESLNVDVSKAFYNENPKYPQAWYDANKKTNPYAEDRRW